MKPYCQFLLSVFLCWPLVIWLSLASWWVVPGTCWVSWVCVRRSSRSWTGSWISFCSLYLCSTSCVLIGPIGREFGCGFLTCVSQWGSASLLQSASRAKNCRMYMHVCGAQSCLQDGGGVVESEAVTCMYCNQDLLYLWGNRKGHLHLGFSIMVVCSW